jgi:hypothetical protein
MVPVLFVRITRFAYGQKKLDELGRQRKEHEEQ